MSDPPFAHILFFALPGFYTLFLVRHIAMYKDALTQAQFVFYSLALSIPSYLAATAVVGTDGIHTTIAVQSAFAAALGAASGCVLRKVLRSGISRDTPWYSFMLDNISEHVVVHTSSKRYYGWIKNASGDDEPRREIVLGDPRRIMDDGSQIRLGDAMLFSEGEVARIVRVRFDHDKDRLAPDG